MFVVILCRLYEYSLEFARRLLWQNTVLRNSWI